MSQLIYLTFQKSTVDKLPLQGMLNTMVDNFSMLFTHVSSSAIISAMIGCLAQPVGELFHDVARRTSVKVYNNAFQQKVIFCSLNIVTCLNFGTPRIIDFPFGTNGKLFILGVPVLSSLWCIFYLVQPH